MKHIMMTIKQGNRMEIEHMTLKKVKQITKCKRCGKVIKDCKNFQEYHTNRFNQTKKEILQRILIKKRNSKCLKN